MTQIKVNGHNQTKGNGHTNGHHAHGTEAHNRAHPQTSFAETSIDPSSFFGKLRKLYFEKVLKTQLEQLKRQGSYDAFKLEWHPAYEVRRLHGGKTRADGIPPSLFWESDVGKWIEAACYFLASTDGAQSMHAEVFKHSIQELVDMIEKAQQPDGYLIIYFTVVDKEGRFRNTRDLHEMYNTGHLIEAALAHYHLTGSRQFLNVMIRSLECFMNQFGPENNKKHGYPGHPEIELAVLRLYQVTRDQRHLDFAFYLLSERGVTREDLGNKQYYVWEAEQRGDEVYPATMDSLGDTAYSQSHKPLHEQKTIEGHSVRALYLTTAAADIGGDFLKDAQRLFADAVDKKMYATGGLGSRPRTEGFHTEPYRLPQSTDEGGCYAETCASIACMMTAERILSHSIEPKARDILERCLYNNVIGGGSLDGTRFSYANKHATYDDETAIRNDWFEVCCCPPNLSRTLGMLGGYTWAAKVDSATKTINLDVYLLLSASRAIILPNGETAQVEMKSEMPWNGKTRWSLSAPNGWKWKLRLPEPEYAENTHVSRPTTPDHGFLAVDLDARSSIEMYFDLPVQLLASHPLTGQDNLTVRKGPIVYVAETIDNQQLEKDYPHFAGLGIPPTAQITPENMTIEGLNVTGLVINASDVYAVQQLGQEPAFGLVTSKNPARSWKKLDQEIKLVPWFARANRGGAGHVRVALLRVDQHSL